MQLLRLPAELLLPHVTFRIIFGPWLFFVRRLPMLM
jgi:hypothetical protein